MGAFDAVRREHAAMAAEAYNDDHVYKQKLNQVRGVDVMSSRYAQVTQNLSRSNSAICSIEGID